LFTGFFLCGNIVATLLLTLSSLPAPFLVVRLNTEAGIKIYFANKIVNLQSLILSILKMPLFYQQNINADTKLAIWKIEETEQFFDIGAPLHREIKHPHKRLQHLAGRYLLPFLFSDFPNKEIEIADTRRPFLPNEQYHFSISHCGNFASAIVSSNHRVGIDVELITPRLEKIKTKFLHPNELRFVNSQSSLYQLNLLSILWSAKEAMYKWYGEGEVDFKEMMQTFPFAYGNEGVIDAAFIKLPIQQKLLLHFKKMEDLTMVWVASQTEL